MSIKGGMEFNSLGLRRQECAAFTGYRPSKFAASFPENDAQLRVRELLRPVLVDLYKGGIRMFLSGMAEGFDIWAALEVLSLRDEGVCPAAGVACVIPYAGQSSAYGSGSAGSYDYILGESTLKNVLSPVYYPDCFHRRNDFLVDNASVVVCYYDGQRGGTAYTVKRAARMHVPVVNLYASEPLLF